MTHVVTVLEAHVPPDRAADLQAAYAAAKGPLPRGLVRSTLLQDANDPTSWRIETVWQSHEAVAAVRLAGRPRGFQIFEAAGTAPSLSMFTAIAELAPSEGAA